MNTEHASKQGKYYTVTEIAGLLGISLGRLRNKLCAGSPLPPRIQPPGCRNRLWPSQAVHDWLEQFTITVTDPDTHNSEPRRRGQGGEHRGNELGLAAKAFAHPETDSDGTGRCCQ